MISSPHRIRRQRWLVTTGTEESAFSVRKALHDHYEDLLLPLFEEVFDKLSPDHEVLHIPKLEIRLQLNLEEDLWKMLPVELLKEVTKILPSSVPGKADSENSGSEKFEPIRYNFLLLINYLKEGRIPWQLSSLSSTEIQSLWKENISVSLPDLIACCNNTEPSEAFIFRMLQLLPAENTREFIGKLEPKSEQLKLLVSKVLDADSLFDTHSRFTLAAFLISGMLSSNGDPFLTELIPAMKQLLPGHKAVWLQSFFDTLPPSFTRILPDTLASEIIPVEPSIKNQADTQNLAASPDQAKGFNPDFSAEKTASEAFPDFLISNQNTADPEMPGLKIPNAGLILLHPFLKPLFTHCGVLSENALEITSEHRPHAAALLHFLATGKEEVHEFELGFIKLLIGMDPYQSLPLAEGCLNDADKDEIHSLLESVIFHWGILKNTSAEGLRTSFLQRSAMLSGTREDWMLRMESSVYDMLLNHLPWSFSLVKLPWMKKPVYTEWILP